jgi:hypothetical protein
MKKYLSLVLIGSFIVFAVPSRGDEEKKADEYPLTTCVVSGESLGEMGDAYSYHHGDREVRFCCKKCVKDFLKDPDKYLAKIDAAAAEKSEANADESGGGHTEHHHEEAK